MTSTVRPKRVLTALIVVLAAAGAGCGSSGEEPRVVLSEPPEATTTSSTTTPTTTLQPSTNDGPVDLPVTGPVVALEPGTTYVTDTDVPFSFSVAESEADWWPVVGDNWSVSMVFANMAGGELSGPQLSLGVAEPGATRESVLAAMIASAEPLEFQVSEGLLGGRDATILEGSLEISAVPGPRELLTGEDSSIEVIYLPGRTYRSHVFEEDGRVFIVTVEASSGMSVVLAESAPVFESLQIGGAE